MRLNHPTLCGTHSPYALWYPFTLHSVGLIHPTLYATQPPCTLWDPSTLHSMRLNHPALCGTHSPYALWEPTTLHSVGPIHPALYGNYALWHLTILHSVAPNHPTPPFTLRIDTDDDGYQRGWQQDVPGREDSPITVGSKSGQSSRRSCVPF